MDKKQELIDLAKQAPQGVNPFYYAIGTMGGNAVKSKYSSLEEIEKINK